jgi:N-acetylmuramoyl-L-alanine amidase
MALRSESLHHPECRNSNSLGIDLCVRNKGNQADSSKDWYFEDTTVQEGIELTKALMEKYNVPADRVIRHHDVTGKICPNPYVYNHTQHTWDAFKAALIATVEYTPGWNHDKNGWWYADSKTSYYKSCWRIIKDHKYYFNLDGYAVTGWQVIDGKDYYFEPRAGHPLECALYLSDQSGVQFIGKF